MVQGSDTCSDGLSDTVVRECGVPLIQSGVWDSATVYHRSVVTEEFGAAFYGDPKVSKGCPAITLETRMPLFGPFSYPLCFAKRVGHFSPEAVLP